MNLLFLSPSFSADQLGPAAYIRVQRKRKQLPRNRLPEINRTEISVSQLLSLFTFASRFEWSWDRINFYTQLFYPNLRDYQYPGFKPWTCDCWICIVTV